MNTEVLWDVAYGLESLTWKTWKSNHLQMQWLKNDNYFSLVILRPWVFNLQAPAWKFDSQQLSDGRAAVTTYISFT